MKRALCLILSICFLCITGASCAEKPVQLKVLVFGTNEDSEGVDLSIWARDLRETHQDQSAPKTQKITLLGKEFEGEYLYSSVFYPATHLSHMYQSEYGTFAINASTGEVDAFNIGYPEKDETISIDECRENAAKIAEQFIDTSEYTMTESTGETKHSFLYVKNIDGMGAIDKLNIGMSVYTGGFAQLGRSLVGSISNDSATKKTVRRLKSADLESALEAKIHARFDEELGKFEWEHDDYIVSRLPDGTIAFVTSVVIRAALQAEDEDGEYTYPFTKVADVYIFEDNGASSAK